MRLQRLLKSHASTHTCNFDEARRETLSWPRWGAAIACIGWFPGAVFFPLGLQVLAGPIKSTTAMHLVGSILLSGTVAITYCVVGLQLVALRIYYPALWSSAEQLREKARRELKFEDRWLRLSQTLAGVLPLLSAIFLVGLGPTAMFGWQYRFYQCMVIVLIALGLAGLRLALGIAARLHNTIAAFVDWRHMRG